MSGRAGLRPRGDLIRLLGTGAALVSVFIAFVFLSIYLSDKYGIDFGRYVPRGALALYIWATVFLAMITYQSLRFFLGAKRVVDWVLRLPLTLVRIVQVKDAKLMKKVNF